MGTWRPSQMQVKYEVNKKLKTPVTLLQQDQASFH